MDDDKGGTCQRAVAQVALAVEIGRDVTKAVRAAHLAGVEPDVNSDLAYELGSRGSVDATGAGQPRLVAAHRRPGGAEDHRERDADPTPFCGLNCVLYWPS